MRIEINSTVGVIIDIQERLFTVMHEAPRVGQKTATLVRGLQALGVPLIATEQYPKGLGPTIDSVREAFTSTDVAIEATGGADSPDTTAPAGFEPIVKSAFSCCDDDLFMERLRSLTPGTPTPNAPVTVLLAGIEAHVCMLQTAVDLSAAGYTPVVVADATSSRSAFDRDTAFRRLEVEGIRLTTVESVLFELTRISGTAAFKAISTLIK